jgi:hypothetical protein
MRLTESGHCSQSWPIVDGQIVPADKKPKAPPQGLPMLPVAPVDVTIGSTSSVQPITSCDPIGNAHPLCGWQNPEDMEALPDGRYVIVSEIGGQNGERPGMLSLLDLETETRQVLYDGGSSQTAGEWGEQSCLEVAQGVFSPHGIHFSLRADGRMQLLVVQHGGRESIEMFEVIQASDRWQLAWRECAIAPNGSMINDVVATPEGGFLVTHMMTKRNDDMAPLVNT